LFSATSATYPKELSSHWLTYFGWMFGPRHDLRDPNAIKRSQSNHRDGNSCSQAFAKNSKKGV